MEVLVIFFGLVFLFHASRSGVLEQIAEILAFFKNSPTVDVGVT